MYAPLYQIFKQIKKNDRNVLMIDKNALKVYLFSNGEKILNHGLDAIIRRFDT